MRSRGTQICITWAHKLLLRQRGRMHAGNAFFPIRREILMGYSSVIGKETEEERPEGKREFRREQHFEGKAILKRILAEEEKAAGN